MIETIHIENYKSIHSLDLELGRVTVLIGENGSGKSNILEAIALASAASQNKLDNEFLVSRGIRVNNSKFMKSAFNYEDHTSEVEEKEIKINIRCGKQSISYILDSKNSPYSKWNVTKSLDPLPKESHELEQNAERFLALEIKESEKTVLSIFLEQKLKEILNRYKDFEDQIYLEDYLVFSPENSSLRLFEKEAQIEPLGINGEGLYKLLIVTAKTEPKKINVIKENLSLISWFENFDLPESQFGNLEIVIKDKYIEQLESEFYNHKNTNEGFLFLLFYILLFVSDKTPKFFAIDNIDASLNPKLCTELTKKIVQLAKEYDKQVILTTHNPAILDGIDLTDEEQKILVVSRNKKGHTRTRTIKPLRVPEGDIPVELSEAFLGGMLGGLPKHF
jgi:predicted ATPase